MTHDRATRLTDAASLRVLAHPTRLRLLGLLRQHGPQTAAHLGDRVDEAPGTISYHLGKLASIALIEEAPGTGTDRRERWWRATSELTTWEPADALDDPATAAASTAMQRTTSSRSPPCPASGSPQPPAATAPCASPRPSWPSCAPSSRP